MSQDGDMFHDDSPPVAPHGDGPVAVPWGVNVLVGLDILDIDIPASAATGIADEQPSELGKPDVEKVWSLSCRSQMTS